MSLLLSTKPSRERIVGETVLAQIVDVFEFKIHCDRVFKDAVEQFGRRPIELAGKFT